MPGGPGGKRKRHADLAVGTQHDEVTIFEALQVLGRRLRPADQFGDLVGSRGKASVSERQVDVAAKVEFVHLCTVGDWRQKERETPDVVELVSAADLLASGSRRRTRLVLRRP